VSEPTTWAGEPCEFCNHRAHDPGSCLDERACGCEVHTDTALAFVRRVDPELFRAAALAEREAEVDRLRKALKWALARLAPFTHLATCSPDECVCGFWEARAALAETPLTGSPLSSESPTSLLP
jgi:hypothetical protein